MLIRPVDFGRSEKQSDLINTTSMHTQPQPHPQLESVKLQHVMARSLAERRGAFGLIYDHYFSAGMCRENPRGLRITPYQLLDTTSVFVTKRREQVVSTMTLVCDGLLGLPMEPIYPQLFREAREAGLRTAEVTSMALGDMREFLMISRVMVQSARFQRVNQLLIMVRPNHARFYNRIGFEFAGEAASCPHVLGEVGVAMRMDFDELDRNPPTRELYEHYFGSRLTDEQLRPSPMSLNEQILWKRQIDPRYADDTDDFEVDFHFFDAASKTPAA